jgi:hypothetical protein
MATSVAMITATITISQKDDHNLAVTALTPRFAT